MKISARTEYACIAVLDLAARYGSGEPARVRDIADAHRIPARFLVQILLQLKTAGLVNSVRGAAGGYQLIRPPEEVTLAAVMAAVEGHPAPAGQAATASSQTRALHHVWRAAAEAQQELLAGVTLADLLDRAQETAEPMYYI
ncbi:MAG: Rrf2 family transcriptional regulator [Planctomycetales bacterium]|nr:Rrf2 family transcriptional regulator [Planctomycetales bacterium]NIM08587.1 Rrf2 family transcriptional regulator [Planctomycetales bacterium]NIN08056.1 Rrf2 family transcriptional regulator [Planctomycetales bacterium]NIN77192.1 Rrf2 family transcriptional regulator [Planctomycetales bacterium]NIO34374.1 Rrf2 family transcriptional regulator [Planctomycetales bacterium]